MGYSDHVRADFDKMESDYLQLVEKRTHNYHKRSLYVTVTVIAVAIAIILLMDSGMEIIRPNVRENITEIPWSPVKLSDLPAANKEK